MNLREIREVLLKNKNVARESTIVRHGDSSLYRFTNLEEFRKSIQNLSDISFLMPELKKVKATSLYRDNRDELMVSNKENNIIEDSSTLISNQIVGVVKFIDELTKDDQEHLIYIRLPEFSSIDEFISTLSEVKKAVEIPSLEIGGEAKILNCESGSIWVTILLGSLVSVRLIGKLVKIATDANLEIQKANIFKNYAGNLKLQNDILEQFKEAQDELLKNLIGKGAKEISDNEFQDKDNERIERLKLAIKSISSLLEKGAKFLPSFKSSDEIKQLYPKPEDEIDMIEQNVKSLLQGGNDASVEEEQNDIED